jgi:acetyltransferase-like isoleucine patch superfamily enzyme
MTFSAFFSEFRLYICNEWVCVIPSHKFRNWFYAKVMGFDIDKNSAIFMHCSFDCARGLSIGAFSIINARCRVDPRGGVKIGERVSISSDVIILTADHEPDEFGNDRVRPVVIEDNVWIGTRAMILSGVTIGNGAKVAAGAIVTKDVPPLAVYGGIPAKLMKMQEERTFIMKGKKPYRRLFQ